MFDATRAKHSKPLARPIEEQGERESQRLWEKTVQAIIASNHTAATDEKTKIEDRQRDEAARRADDGVDWKPRLFRAVQGGPGGPDEGDEDLDWIINAHMYVLQGWSALTPPLIFRSSDSHNPEAATKQILAIAPILKGQKESSQFQIPPHRPSNSANQVPSGTYGITANASGADQSAGNDTAGEQRHVVERMDTQTNSVDQFVDAEEKQ